MTTATRDAVEELLQTYGETGGINYLAAAASLPSRLSIEAACTELMSLMFPGFRSEALVSSEDLADTTRIRVRHLHARLKTEICRSLGRVPPDEPTEAKAEEVLSSAEMIAGREAKMKADVMAGHRITEVMGRDYETMLAR